MVRLASSQPDTRAQANALAPVNRLVDERRIRELRFNLAYSLLQTNLDLTATLQQFFDNLQDFVKTSGIEYVHDNHQIQLSFGKICAHKATYSIATEELQLGKVTFTRGKRFAETELAILEMMIGVLFFPLRNALMYEEALASSLTDKLTGIGNRGAMDIAFERELKLAQRHEEPLSVLVIDVDHFKHVNDSFGHVDGDRALKQVVNSIQNTLRETDQVFRYGGEEFIALLHNTGAHEAMVIAERIRVNVAMSPISFDNEDLLCTVSIGAACYDGIENCTELLEKADTALYAAKNGGRNRVELWHSAK